MYKLIVCTNLVGAIGKDNKSYHIPNDDNFKRFARLICSYHGYEYIILRIRNQLRIGCVLIEP